MDETISPGGKQFQIIKGNPNTKFSITPASKLHSLADCPWPAADSHCSPCTLWIDDESGFFVWGEYAGNVHRESIYAQQTCVDVVNIKRLVFKVARTKATAVPDGDGLYIGLVSQASLDYYTKFEGSGDLTSFWLDTWEWIGYLPTLPGGTPIEHYYLCVDLDQDFSTEDYWYLIMATNGSYEVCGWQMGGFGDTGFNPDVLRLSRYFRNEPGHEDGWEVVDNYFRGCVIPYTAGGGALIEGFCQILEPIFPSSVTEGEDYIFTWLQTNETAFPCGCPEDLVWQLFDRASGNPIMDPVTYQLECGYGGVYFGGTLVFSGGGTFQGRLVAGHMVGTELVADDYFDFDVEVIALPCSTWSQTECEQHACWWWNQACREDQPTSCDQLNNQFDCERWGCLWYGGACHSTQDCESYQTQSECEAAGCLWWNASCHSDNPTSCDQLNNQSDCELWGCLWWNASCHSDNPTSCDQLNNQSDCELWGCLWWNASCHSDNPTSCDQLNNQSDCELWGCYWYDGSCHSTHEPADLCQWIIDHGGAHGLDITEIFVIIDSYILQSPPQGYDFIPTIQQTFGVIDYFLGFNGDPLTGCNLW